jgi:prevent-host-death family protein
VSDAALYRSGLVLGLDGTYAMSYALPVTTLSATEARKRLYELLDRASEAHEPIQITGRRNAAVLVSEGDWRAIQETLYLLSVPGMRESIRKGMKTSIKKCSSSPGW